MARCTTLAATVVGLLLSLSAGAPFARAASENPLVGVWQVESQTGFAGVYIFTTTHYSMMVAGTDRPDIVDTSKSTADELRSLWGPMLANSGTYDIAEDLLTIHPIVAKIPVVMKPGAFEVYRFHIEGNTLTLTQVRNVRGPVDRGSTTRLVRAQ